MKKNSLALSSIWVTTFLLLMNQAVESNLMKTDSATPVILKNAADIKSKSRTAGNKDTGYLPSLKQNWELLGSWFGGHIEKLISDPKNGQILYAVDRNASYLQSTTLYKSLDSGKTWGKIVVFKDSIQDLLIDPIDSNRLYAHSNNHFYISTNGGGNWKKTMVFDFIEKTAIHPRIRIIYVMTSGLFKSSDGVHWEELSSTPEGYEDLVLDPLNPNIIYREIEEDWDTFIYKSINGGYSWKKIFSQVHGGAHLFIDPVNPSYLYVCSGGSFYRSINRGTDWMMISEEKILTGLNGLIFDPTDSAILYLESDQKLYKSQDQGRTWDKILDQDVGSFSLDPVNSMTIYVTVIEDSRAAEETEKYRLFISNDGGRSWTKRNLDIRGYYHSNFLCMASQIFITTEKGVFVSRDSGLSWQESHLGINSDVTIQYLKVSPSSSNIIYASISYNGIFKSHDYGLSWERIHHGKIGRIELNPQNSDEIMAVEYLKPDMPQVVKSIDGGLSWKTIDFPVGAFEHVPGLAYNPSDPSIIYTNLWVWRGYKGPAFNVIAKSTDGGSTWNLNRLRDRDGSGTITVDPRNPDIVYAGGGRLKTIDGGENWVKLTPPVRELEIFIDPLYPHRIYLPYQGFAASELDGIYLSRDSGLSWKKMTSFPVHSIEINRANPKEIFTAGSKGLFHSRDKGQSWEKFSDMNVVGMSCDSLHNILYIGNSNGQIYRYRLSPELCGLTIIKSPGGSTDPQTGNHIYEKGENAYITATPDIGFHFLNWSGDVSGSENPLWLTMDRDKTITPVFSRIIYPPLDFSGRKAANRSLFQAEQINILTWRHNPGNIDIVKYRIYLDTGAGQNLLAEIHAGTWEFRHRGLDRTGTYTYILRAVNLYGQEGLPTVTVIQ